MPANSGTYAYNIGRDCQVVLIGPFGRVDLSHVTGFEADQVTQAVKVKRLDGLTLNAELPDGWHGSFMVDRGNRAVDQLFQQIEDGWYNSGSTAASTIYQYIAETDGSQTTYQFDNVALKLGKGGSWKSDATVQQTISFTASRRRSV